MPYQPLPKELRAPKPASQHTQRAQAKVREELNFDDRQSFEDARKGFIATIKPLTLHSEGGQITYDLERVSFLKKEEAPDTVNPSLWRQAQLNAPHNGLYELSDGLY